jgi:GMP synthase PP-ATPase subunit
MSIKKNAKYKFLAQGTLYPDVVESSSAKGSASQVIKSHHNVGGLPDDMEFELVEPFRDLFKDEVREVGRRLGVPDQIVDRHPFPGPGLAIRVIGDILRRADKIFIDELKNTLTDEEVEKRKKFSQDSDFWTSLAEGRDGKNLGVKCLIFNKKSEVFTQKRNASRVIFPNLWETGIGGKVEEGENIRDAIEREVFEETGWKVSRIVDYWGQEDWIVNDKMARDWQNFVPQRSFYFLIEVNGDLENPKIEKNKVDEYRWVNETQLDIFESNIESEETGLEYIQKFFTEKWFSKSKKTTLYHDTWQAFCVLTPVQTVGVMGDGRTYENVLGLRAVTAADGMTADWARLPYDFLAKVSNKIINEVRGVNRVVYDISSKPPATIEWE